ncbi:MAG: hypothetical protein HC880_07230 [Bacteroidia bacterium]|nr:hypothetical protein [Bacteroidia bacterium]
MLDTYQPNYIILNGGAARFVTGDPMTLWPRLAMHPKRRCMWCIWNQPIIALRTERLVKSALIVHGLEARCLVPNDGEWISLT